MEVRIFGLKTPTFFRSIGNIICRDVLTTQSEYIIRQHNSFLSPNTKSRYLGIRLAVTAKNRAG